MAAASQFVTVTKDLQHRLQCCRRGDADGYGDVPSLRNVYQAACGLLGRFDTQELRRENPRDLIVREILVECDALAVVLRDVQQYLGI